MAQIWNLSYFMLNMFKIDIKNEKKTDFRMFQYIWLLKVVKVEGR